MELPMHPDRIQQVQDLLAGAPTNLASVLELRCRLQVEIQTIQEKNSPQEADRLLFYEKQLRDLDMALGEARTFILGFNQSLTSIQEIVEQKLDDPRSIAREKARLKSQPMLRATRPRQINTNSAGNYHR